MVVLCMVLVGCGGARHGASSAPRSSSTVASPGAIAPSLSLTGDYDRDDDPGKRPGGDIDNDDSTRPKDADNDSDNPSKSYFDRDDDSARRFGLAASAADRRAIVGLVKRYFEAASAGKGASACSMIVSALAKSVSETLGGAGGPRYARGPTCAVVMSGIFRHYHRQIAAHAATLRLSDVRVQEDQGMTVLAFKRLPGRSMPVAREHGVWRVNTLLDFELP